MSLNIERLVERNRCPRCKSVEYELISYGSGRPGGSCITSEKRKYQCKTCGLRFGALGLTDEELFQYYKNDIIAHICCALDSKETGDERGFDLQMIYLWSSFLNPPVEFKNKLGEFALDLIKSFGEFKPDLENRPIICTGCQNNLRHSNVHKDGCLKNRK